MYAADDKANSFAIKKDEIERVAKPTVISHVSAARLLRDLRRWGAPVDGASGPCGGALGCMGVLGSCY